MVFVGWLEMLAAIQLYENLLSPTRELWLRRYQP
jgi:hypothetical protein